MKNIKINICILSCLMGCAFLFHYFYRPFIYKNHLFDYHLSDFFPNLISVPSISVLWIIIFEIQKKENIYPFKLIVKATVGIILYEFIQLLGNGFDWLDIFATFVGAGLTYLFFCIKKGNIIVG